VIIDSGKEQAGADYHSVVITPTQQLFLLRFGERFVQLAKVPAMRFAVLSLGALSIIQDLGSSRLWKKLGDRVRSKFVVYTDLTPNLNQFQIAFTELLGIGSFGSVFKMTYKGTPVAVKQMKICDLDIVAREVSVQSMITHPNLVQMFGVFSYGTPEAIHLVAEYADSGDLMSFLSHHKGQIPEQLKLSFARDICDGLACLHSFGIVHRDLKSENILVFQKKLCKLADFGLARTSTAAFSRTMVAGTFLYQAPELVLAQKKSASVIKMAEAQVETSSDIYSLGYILWEIASEQRVYSDQAQLEVMQSKIKDASGQSKIRRLVGGSDRLPLPLPESRWDAHIKACWAYKPDSRPTAISLEAAFETLLNSGSSS
jgi:serine/threonine protein kinase